LIAAIFAAKRSGGDSPSSRLIPAAPARTSSSTNSATAAGSDEKPASLSTERGTPSTRTISATIDSSVAFGKASPSG